MAPGGAGGRRPPGDSAGPAFANRSDTVIGIVDQIVDGRFVVILVLDEGEIVDQTVLEIDDQVLPDVGDDVLLLAFDDDGDPVAVERLEGETRRHRRARERFEELSGRSGGPGRGPEG